MKLTTGIVAIAITVAAGAAYAQSPDAIDNARSTAKSLQQQQATTAAAAPAKSKPAPGATQGVKPAAIPGAKSASDQHNQLQHVSVAQSTDTVQIEITSSQAVTPKVSKLSSPARVLVELPGTVIATAQTKIPVGSAGVKGVRIGMDGKTPPTTSVVVDLEKTMAFDLTPGSAGKVVLTVHTQGGGTEAAKSSPAPGKTAAPAAQPKVVASAQPKSAASAQPKAVVMTPAAPATQAKPAVAKMAPVPAPKVAAVSAPAAKPDAKQQAKASPAAKPVIAAAAPAKADAFKPKLEAKKGEENKPEQKKAEEKKPEEKKWAMNGKRDPFFSPVVQQSGSGCSTGKKCLEIGAINLRGVVKSDSGFIAVVTNNLNKAYFLRENDPVFNGYVVKITGDSVVFEETIQDKLGKSFTREVVKKIFTPAV